MLYLCTSKMLLLTFILKFKSSYFCILMEHEVFVLERKREINQKDLIACSALIGFISFHN